MIVPYIISQIFAYLNVTPSIKQTSSIIVVQ